jgi:hypothetical protein
VVSIVGRLDRRCDGHADRLAPSAGAR